ncbi:hypothetical protein [Streptomyces prasinosporus]
MTLARSLPDDATEWWVLLGALALYVLGRWFFAWRQARREGDARPARAAFAEEDDADAVGAASTGGFRSYQQFLGFVAGSFLVALTAALTDGRLRVTLLWTVVPPVVVALAYLDFRQVRRARSGV